MPDFLNDAELVSFEFSAETQSQILNPETFLGVWNEYVRILKNLTDNLPGSHKDDLKPKLKFIEVFDETDSEIIDKIAVWSESTGSVKLNGIQFRDFYVNAFNQYPVVAEFLEALGVAAFKFQQKDPSAGNASAEILGGPELSIGFKHVCAFYPLIVLARGCSSVFYPGEVLDTSKILTQDLVRCYQKKRLYRRGDYLFDTQIADEDKDLDIVYGMFLELLVVGQKWDLLEILVDYLITNIQEKYPDWDVYTNKTGFERLVLTISEFFEVRLRTLMLSWGFSDVEFLNQLPESYRDLYGSASIEISSKMQKIVDPDIVKRELNNELLPEYILGCSDSFGFGKHTNPILVLDGEEPEDSVSYSDLYGYLFFGNESNSHEKSFLLPCNLGEISQHPVTLLVPVAEISEILENEYEDDSLKLAFSYIDNFNLPANESIFYAKIVHLGNQYVPYKIPAVVDNDDEGDQEIKEIELDYKSYAIISYDTNTGRFKPVLNNRAQLISFESFSNNTYYNPDTEENVFNRDGTYVVIRSITTYLEDIGTVVRSIKTATVILDDERYEVARLEETNSNIRDPFVWPVREKPASLERSSINLLSGIHHEVLSEISGFYMRVTGTTLGSFAGIENTTSGYKLSSSVDDVLKTVVVDNKQDNYQFISVPPENLMTLKFNIEKIKLSTRTSEEKTYDIFRSVIDFYEKLPFTTKFDIENLNPSLYIIPKTMDFDFPVKIPGSNSEVGIKDVVYGISKMRQKPYSAMADSLIAESASIVEKNISDKKSLEIMYNSNIERSIN